MIEVVAKMYYYHSLTYVLAPGDRCCFLGADLGMDHDPYLRWKVSRPISDSEERIMFLNPAKLRICKQLFSILAYLISRQILRSSSTTNTCFFTAAPPIVFGMLRVTKSIQGQPCCPCMFAVQQIKVNRSIGYNFKICWVSYIAHTR